MLWTAPIGTIVMYTLVADPRIAHGYFFYDRVIIWNIFECISTWVALYMYKQYIVGFMMIEGIVLELDVERIEL